MSKVREFTTAAAGSATNASASRNGPVGDCLTNPGTSTESQIQRQERTSGTYSQLYARSIVTPTATCTVRFRVDAANGNQNVAVTASGEYTDETHTDAVTAGSNKINFQFVTGSTTQASFTGVGVSFAAGSNTAKRIAVYGGPITPSSSTTVYFSAGSASTTTQANVQLKIRTGGTLQNLQVQCSVAPAASATCNVMVAAATNGNQTVAFTGTGITEDTTHTDTVVSTNLINLSWIAGAGSVGTVRLFSVEMVTTDTSWILCGGLGSGVTQLKNVTAYVPFTGDSQSSATEANVNVLLDSAYTLSNLGILVTTNTVSGSSTFNARKNSGACNSSAAIGSNTTGFIEDTTNTDSLVGTDEVNHSLVTANAGTSLIYTTVAAKMADTVAGGTGFKHKGRIM